MKKISLLSLAAVCALASDAVMVPNIDVAASSIDTPAANSLNVVQAPNGLKTTGDSASLLADLPGVSMNSNGGIASLPSIHGMADTRVKTEIDGMTITAACPNHMNPALSYFDTSDIQYMEVMAGITPVSYGGDSIGGTIIVKTKDPIFAKSPDEVAFHGNLNAFSHSNNGAVGVGVNASAATDKIAVSYAGFAEQAGNYRDGHGNIVKDTLFNQRKQTLSLAYKIDDENVISAKVSKADISDEGFVNQYMDMLSNSATNTNIAYKGHIGDLLLDMNGYRQNTDHYMNKILTERTGNMPMNTKGVETGYNIKATLPINDMHTLKFGSDLDLYSLNDWWPAATPGVTSGMGGNTYENINNGHRDRIGFYLEEIAQWNDKFSTNFGARTDIVTMKTGDVVGYNSSINDPIDAKNFNALNHSTRDTNYDLTAMSKYIYSDMSEIEFGFSRKTRSPDLYERYSWAGGYNNNNNASSLGKTSGPIAMDMAMINTYGDGNGYVGNINLKPEVANTFSATWSLHDASQKEWGFKLTPYYTGVQNYIDVQSLGMATVGGYKGIELLQFINDDAIIYGADVSGYATVWDNSQYGKGIIKTVMGYTRGMRADGGSLYHVMPFHAKVSLDRYIGKWNNGIDIQAVASKDSVDEIRNEPKTPAYTLIDLRTGYQVTKNIKFEVAVMNLMNLAYAMPLGGVDVVNYAKTSYTPLQGMGRSIDTSVNIQF